MKVAEDWVEAMTAFFLVLGFMISILLQNAVWSYFSVVISGFIAGRLYYLRRFKDPILPFLLIMVGFLLGYIIGGFWISRFWVVAFFLLSFGLSYYLHLKKILATFKSEQFIK